MSATRRGFLGMLGGALASLLVPWKRESAAALECYENRPLATKTPLSNGAINDAYAQLVAEIEKDLAQFYFQAATRQSQEFRKMTVS